MKLFITNIDYKIEGFKPVIYIFTRDKNNKQYIIKDYSFEPYFYVPKRDFDSVILTDKQYSYIKRIEKANIEIPKAGLVQLSELVEGYKITTKYPKHVGLLRKTLEEKYVPTYEADILFNYRYAIDKELITGLEIDDRYFELGKSRQFIPFSDKYCKATNCDYRNYRILFIDIETYGEATSFEEANNPIIIIGIYDSYTKQYYSFYYKQISNPHSSENIKHYNSERSMLYGFIEWYLKHIPDVIVSFTKFDMAYILARMKKLGIDYHSLSPMNWVTYQEERISIKGIEYLDLGEIINEVEGGTKWQTLDAIAKDYLGYGKQPLSFRTIIDTWDNDYYNVITYNLKDVLLIKNLENKLDLIRGYLASIRQIVGCKLNDSMYAARVADIAYLRYLKGKIALPSRPLEKVRRSYSGAKVFIAKRGIYDNIVSLDFKSLYPSIIKAFNIGYNTFDPINGDIVITNEYKYRSKPISWTVDILDKLRVLLDINKEEIKKARQAKDFTKVKQLSRRRLAIKSIVNGIYGFYGYPGDYTRHIKAARLYSWRIAESITIVGRTLIEKTAEIVNRLGYELIFGDTDSIFVKLKTKNYVEEANKLKNNILKLLYKFIRDTWNIDPSPFILEIDEYYKRIIILTKKRYAGLTRDGNKIIKGIEVVRRDQSDLTIETQLKLLDLALNNKPIPQIRSLIVDQIRKIDTYPLEKLGITAILHKHRNQYSSATIQLKAFEFANQILGLDLKEGERFYYIFIKQYKDKPIVVLTKDKITDKLIAKEIFSSVAGFKSSRDITNEIKIDKDKILEKTIKNKIEDLLELLGISWKDLVNEAKNVERSKLNYYLRDYS